MNTKQAIVNALRTFVNQRPGFEYANYGDAASYRADVRKAGKDRAIALQLLRDIELRDSISAEDILRESQSGRVSIRETGGGVTIDYCTGQYFCTEYRAAVARLCASVLWTWKRSDMPQVGAAPVGSGKAEVGMYWNGRRAVSAGDWLRGRFVREYGRGIAGRFFS